MSGGAERPVFLSYKALFRINHVIYRLGDFNLPFPVSVDAVVLWAVYLIVLAALYRIFPPLRLLPVAEPVALAVFPAVLAHLSTKLDPAGKGVPGYLLGLAGWYLRPHFYRRWEAFRPPDERPAKVFWRLRHRFLEKLEDGFRAVLPAEGSFEVLRVLEVPRAAVLIRGTGPGAVLVGPARRGAKGLLNEAGAVTLGRSVRFSTGGPVRILFQGGVGKIAGKTGDISEIENPVIWG